MQITYRKKFLKELSKIPTKYSERIEEFVFDILPLYDNLAEVGNIEKLSGYKDYYKIRFGSYRLGLKKEDEKIIVETIKHRKEIYKFFP